MHYSVEPWLFEALPRLRFGILIGSGMANAESGEADTARLREAERDLRGRVAPESLKEEPPVAIYREALQAVGINPNKYQNSVEAMCKRVLGGHDLPSINALVDTCNAISIEHIVSLGGHDLRDMPEDLWVRRSRKGDSYLPFGASEYESVPEGELVFASGPVVQTRQWLWRQSELGKMTLDSKDVFFQLVGFSGEYFARLEEAMAALASLVEGRFGGRARSFVVDEHKSSIEF